MSSSNNSMNPFQPNVEGSAEPYPLANQSSSSSFSSQRCDVSTLVPPLRLAKIFDGISRSAYPTLKNFRFMRRLQLKTIVSLVPEPPTSDLVDFCALFNIKIVHICVNKAEALQPALQVQLMQGLHVCINRDSHPVHIHCLDGRHVTSLLVLLLQRLIGYSPLSAISEYWRYQISTSSQVTQSEIEKYTKELEKFTNEMGCEIIIPKNIPKWLWNGVRSSSVKGMKIKFDPPVDSGEGGIMGSTSTADLELDRNSESGNSSNIEKVCTPSNTRRSSRSTEGVAVPPSSTNFGSEESGLVAGNLVNSVSATGNSTMTSSAGIDDGSGNIISRNVHALSLDGLDIGFVRKKISQ